MHLDLSDAETAALTKELDDIAGNDRYPVIRLGSAAASSHSEEGPTQL